MITLLSGSGFALAITYLSQLVLARLYPPDAFGVSDYFVMAVTVLLSLASLRYEDAVMTPESDAEARRILWLAMLLTTVIAAIMAVAALMPRTVSSALGVPELAPWLWLLAPTLVFTKAARLLEVWLSRERRFRRMSGGQISSAGATAAFRIGAGIGPTAGGAGGLIGGFLAGQLAALAFMLPGRQKKSNREVSHQEAHAPGFTAIANRYRRFALFSTPAAVLNAAFARLPTILLPLFFSWTVVGYYGRAFVALAVPLGLFGSAVAQVFFVHAGEAMRTGSIARITSQVHDRLVMLGLLPTAAVMIAGPDLFEVLFGANWRPSGDYLRYVAPWLFLAAVAAPLTRVFDVLERQRADLLTSIGMFVLQGTAIVIGGRSGSLELTLLLMGATGLLARAAHIGVMLLLSRVPGREVLAPYLRYAGIGVAPLLLIGVAAYFASPFVTLVVTVIALAGYYAFIGLKGGMLLPPGSTGTAKEST